MDKRSAYIVLGIGAMFCIVAVFRLFNFEVSGFVVAIFSLTAALISLSDLLEITRYKNYVIRVLILALVIFIGALTILVLKIEVEFPFISNMGDSFTLIGLGLVIVLYGLKELIEKDEIIPLENEIIPLEEELKIARYKVTKNEYNEMMEINDIIERLKDLDNRVLNFNKVHDGWASLSETLDFAWHQNNGPFFDGGNREKYSIFLKELDSFVDDISNSAETNYLSTNEKPINMWGVSMPINMQRRSNGRYDLPLQSILTKRQNVLKLWTEFKDIVNKRYENERSKI
ncbi:APC family permease [Lysinibacillus sp. NPDC093712]|uniref:APC family permease n=1 Tax=Lysinibacillus sp. NPDC093712 TaxID=3390579 RepID=UPI003CFC148C